MEIRSGNTVCPLLKNPKQYNPDTIDLLNNAQERNYWLPCLDRMIKNFVSKAPALNPEDLHAADKAESSYKKFHELILQIQNNQIILQPLSVRTLLEFNEELLRENFKDAYYHQKKKETLAAFQQFKERLLLIDSIETFENKWLEIITGVLAGNVFDWGAKSVADILEKNKTFGLNEAKETMQSRPWFKDNFDDFIYKLKVHHYNKVVIFVDNAGIDFVLGILPMVREWLHLHTKVVLVGNSLPALNDMTYKEIKICINEAAIYCNIFQDAINEGQLIFKENGQKGPCLDLTDLPEDLCNAMETADFVILEGMGRAVQTNLYAKFNVDCLKLAVLKNEWLAKSLGASQFYVICDFETS